MFLRFIKRKLFKWLTLVLAMTGFAISNNDIHAAQEQILKQNRNQTSMEEVRVEGERIDPASLALQVMEVIYYQKAKAARNFKIGNYERAFPELQHLAKMGFKDEQARLAYIYLHGLGNQQKSNLRALAWLGTATAGTTRPQYRNLYNKLIAQVPPEQQDNVARIVDGYRERYRSDANGITCERSRTGHLDNLTCLFDQQRNKHIDRLMSLAKTGQVPWVLTGASIDESIQDTGDSYHLELR